MAICGRAKSILFSYLEIAEHATEKMQEFLLDENREDVLIVS